MYLMQVDGSIDMKYIDNWYGIQLIANKFIHFCVINLELYAKRCSGWLYSSSLMNYRSVFVKNKEQNKNKDKKRRNFAFALILKKWREVTGARTEPLLSKDVANHTIQSILSDVFILNFVLVLVLSSNFFLRLIFIYEFNYYKIDHLRMWWIQWNSSLLQYF